MSGIVWKGLKHRKKEKIELKELNASDKEFGKKRKPDPKELVVWSRMTPEAYADQVKKYKECSWMLSWGKNWSKRGQYVDRSGAEKAVRTFLLQDRSLRPVYEYVILPKGEKPQ